MTYLYFGHRKGFKSLTAEVLDTHATFSNARTSTGNILMSSTCTQNFHTKLLTISCTYNDHLHTSGPHTSPMQRVKFWGDLEELLYQVWLPRTYEQSDLSPQTQGLPPKSKQTMLLKPLTQFLDRDKHLYSRNNTKRYRPKLFFTSKYRHQCCHHIEKVHALLGA